MKGLERMISRVRAMLTMGMTPNEISRDLAAQGVDNELAFWAIKSAIFEIDYWKKVNNNGNN